MVDGVGVRPMQMKATRKCGLRDKTHGEGVWPQGGGKQCCRILVKGGAGVGWRHCSQGNAETPGL